MVASPCSSLDVRDETSDELREVVGVTVISFMYAREWSMVKSESSVELSDLLPSPTHKGTALPNVLGTICTFILNQQFSQINKNTLSN
jgi:hypothetical protein